MSRLVFSSLLFVYAFFPLNLLCYRLMPDLKWRNRVMLVFSLIFYAWAGPVYLLLLVAMTLADWLVTREMDLCCEQTLRKRWLIIGCVINIGLLCIFKYLTFFLQNFHNWFGVPETVVAITLPIGISFYTFQLLSYIVDVYRKEVAAQQNFFTLLLYVSMFHQCIAGPIVRYEHVEKELTDRKILRADVAYGIRRFTIGLAKKALLANACGSFADSFLVSTSSDTIYDTLVSQPALSVWLGMFAYTMQIYLDFSAYSDMAIGMGRMIGFHYHENFNYPYISKSITEFWRRWHISLSTFFRDYVYIPLGGNRCSKLRHIFNLLVVWALTGFWHGASWNFLLWGLYYFVFLIIEKEVTARSGIHVPRFLSHLYTILIVSFGWMIFRFDALSQVSAVLKGLFGLNGNGFTNYETTVALKGSFFFFIVAILACTPLVKMVGEKIQERALTAHNAQVVLQVAQVAVPIALLILSTAALVGDSYNPFLYFRF